jgi:hypothetical protein
MAIKNNLKKNGILVVLSVVQFSSKNKKKNIKIGLILFILLVSCGQSQNNKFLRSLKKEQNNIELYDKEQIVLKINTNSNIVEFSSSNVQDVPISEYMIPISRYKFFFPKSYSIPYKYMTTRIPLFSHTDNIGDQTFNYYKDKKGFLDKYEISSSDGEKQIIKFIYQNYNLTKIIDDKIINKTLLENKYDEEGQLVYQEKNYEELKSKKDFFYDKKKNLIKEIVWSKEIAPNRNIICEKKHILQYEYNLKEQLIKKYSEDKNYYFEYSYNEKGRLIKELGYTASIDENNPKKITNNFIENSFEYDMSGNLVKEIVKEVPYSNGFILVNKEWQPLNLEEQKKQAWEEYKKNGIYFFTYITTTTYQYLENNIISSIKNVIKNENDGNNYHSIEQTLLQEKIKYTYNNLGQIIKREVFKEGKLEPISIQDYSY